MANIIDQQLKRNDCGISAIKTVCNIHGANIAREIIEDNIFLDQEGASLASMQQFMDDYGFETNYKLLDINDINGNEEELNSWFPCITPIKRRTGLHYVVINGISGGKFNILNPAESRSYKMTVQEFKKEAYYSGSLMKYADMEDILAVKVKEELTKYGITADNRLSRKDLIGNFNKLSYFAYVQQNFGFKDAIAEREFLRDLIFNQEMTTLPKHFQSLKARSQHIQVRAPIMLSVKKTDHVIESTGNNNVNPYWRLFKEIKPMHELWYIFLGAALLVSFIAYIGVFVDQILIDHILPSRELQTLQLFAIGVGVFYLVETAFGLYRKYISIHLGNTLDRYFYGRFDDKLNTFSIRYLQSFKRGDLVERLRDSRSLKSFFMRYFSKIAVNIIVAVVSLAFLFLLNWKLTFLVLVVIVAFVIIFKVFTPIIERLERIRFGRKSEFFSIFMEKLDGIQVIRAMNLENYSSAQITASIDSLIDIRTKGRYVGILNSLVTSLVVTFSSLALLVLTSREMILYNALTLGQILTFLALSSKIFSAFSSLLNANLSLQENKVILARFFAFEETKVKPEDGEKEDENGTADNLPTVGRAAVGNYLIRDFAFDKITLDQVSFAYTDEQYIFKNLSLEIGQKEKIWIKGENGSGKSTLCKVLGMLYQPTHGSLLMNDISTAMYDPKKLRQKVLFVSGEDLLFNETLLFNISFGRKIDMQKLIEYCKVLKIYDFINRKPEKFEYIIHENGRNLSTGQRRKVLLLRALMSTADVVILDEIFNGIDSKSKRRAELLLDFINEKTFVIISHMPIEGMTFDKKYELKNGKLEY